MVTEQFISTGSCQTFSLTAGDAKSQPVLLLHGMKFQAETWKSLGTLDLLANNGFHAIAVDMPGFGKSPDCDLEHGQVVSHVIKQQNLARPVLIGPSMGGRTCLEFALDTPNVIGGLVLIGAVGVVENKDRLAELSVPTLIVWGSTDTVSPLENGRLLAEELGDARLAVIDQAPHPCYLDQPDHWHRELLLFLQQRFQQTLVKQS